MSEQETITLDREHEHDGRKYPPGEYPAADLPAPVRRAVQAEVRTREFTRFLDTLPAPERRQAVKHKLEHYREARYWCDCLRLCRPLMYGERFPDHICPGNYPIICAAWARDMQQERHAGPGQPPDEWTQTVARHHVRILSPYDYPFGLVNRRWVFGGMDGYAAGYVKLVIRQWVEVADGNDGLAKQLPRLASVRAAKKEHEKKRAAMLNKYGAKAFTLGTAQKLKQYIACRLPEMGVPETPGTAAFLLWHIEGRRACDDFGYFLPYNTPTFGEMLTSVLIARVPEDGAPQQPGQHGQHFVDRAYASDWGYKGLEVKVIDTIAQHREFLTGKKVSPALAKHNSRTYNSGAKIKDKNADLEMDIDACLANGLRGEDCIKEVVRLAEVRVLRECIKEGNELMLAEKRAGRTLTTKEREKVKSKTEECVRVYRKAARRRALTRLKHI